MSDNVITFKPRRFDDVWECGYCGGQLFYLLESFRVECRQCGGLSSTLFITKENPSSNA